MNVIQQIIDAIANQLESKWIAVATGALFMLLGWWLGKRRARSEWRRKEFFDRLNVSLNVIRQGRLQIRTLLEKSCKDIFLNTAATDTIVANARVTTAEDSIIPLPKDEYWYYLNAVLNEIAEQFAEGQVKRDLGLPTTAEIYLICLTNECAGAMKTRKLRAMVIKKSLLMNLPREKPTFESPHHETRWHTLGQLAAAYAQHPHKFLEIELVL